MKKTILAVLIALATSVLSGCSVLQSTSQPQKGKTVVLDMKVIQTLSQHSALALTKVSGYSVYLGDVVKVISETGIMYDDLVLKGRFVLVGTYTYETKKETIKTVPVYMSSSEYKNIVNSRRNIEAVVSLLNY